MIFVGYGSDTKGYRLLDPKTHKIIRSRDVVFLEEPKRERNNDENAAGTTSQFQQPVDEIYEEAFEDDVVETDENTSKSTGEDATPADNSDSEYLAEESSTDNSSPESTSDTGSRFSGQEDVADQMVVVPRRSTRIPKPKKMDDFISYLAMERSATDPMTVDEALDRPERELWLKAIEEEKKSLIDNNTWTLATLPQGKKTLDTKWVFKTKKNSSGEVERYKARLVVRGCKQTEGIDYNETYSPVIRYTSVRFLCALAAKYDLRMHQMDVVTVYGLMVMAYLHGDLDEEIYVGPPKELQEPNQQGKVWRLRKAIYRLKQSGRSWNQKLDQTLKELNLTPSKADPYVYFKRQGRKMLILGVYVDDMIVLSSDDELLRTTKQKLSERFKMKDLGEARHLLRLRVTRDKQRGKIWLDQEAYTEEMLERFNMSECKPVPTPADPNQKLSKEQSPTNNIEATEMRETIPYKKAVGSLLYVSQGTRPDIAYAVNLASRFSNNPGKAHWTAIKRIFRYLKGTPKTKLEFSKDGNPRIEGYGDADWANKSEDRRSITGSLFKLQCGPISWQSKKQATVALSTTEAEYMALSATCQEALWLRALAQELDPEAVASGTVIYCDNKGAADLAKTTSYRPRSKHIDVRHHFLRERVQLKEIIVEYVPTEEMSADALTKALFRPKLKSCIGGMGLRV